MADYTPHQKKIISRYYDHRDEIMLTKLQEIVSELLLATGEAAIDRLWKRAATAMVNLKVPDSIREHILTQRKPEVLARNVTQWLSDARKGKK